MDGEHIIGLKTPDTRCTRRATARYKMVVGKTEKNTGGLFSILEKKEVLPVFSPRVLKRAQNTYRRCSTSRYVDSRTVSDRVLCTTVREREDASRSSPESYGGI